MKKIIHSLSLLLWSITISYAQQSSDLPISLENSGIEELEELNQYGDGNKGDAGNETISLKRYCPSAGNHSGQPSGSQLGWAFGYGAMTILRAAQENWSAEKIKKEAFSAKFPFEVLDKDRASCRMENFLVSFKTALIHTGNVKAADYDRKVIACNSSPETKWLSVAKNNRITNMFYVFSKHAGNRSDGFSGIQSKTKWALKNKRPVVAIMRVTSNFAQLKSDTYLPDRRQANTLLQAVVVIGFDDKRQAFEIFNSLGNTWGNQGFAWISYTDFCEWSSMGIQLTWDKPAPSPPGPRVKPAPSEVVAFNGGGTLYDASMNAENVIVNTPIAMKFVDGYYETSERIEEGKSVRFASDNLPKHGFMYLFNVDPQLTVKLLYPKLGESPYVADEGTRLVFPRPVPGFDENNRLIVIDNRGFAKDLPGTEWLIIIYSKGRLSPTLLDKLSNGLAQPGNQVLTSLEKILGDQFIPRKDITFNSQQMRFKVVGNKGTVVPLLIKIKGN